MSSTPSRAPVPSEIARTAVEVGRVSAERTGNSLPPEIVEFCSGIFSRRGAILAGAAGDRFVYEIRRLFHLSYKLNPLRSYPELHSVSRLKAPAEVLDVLLVRENLHGLYQGESQESVSDDGRQIRYTFLHSEKQVRNLLTVAARAARDRRNLLAVIGKGPPCPPSTRSGATAAPRSPPAWASPFLSSMSITPPISSAPLRFSTPGAPQWRALPPHGRGNGSPIPRHPPPSSTPRTVFSLRRFLWRSRRI